MLDTIKGLSPQQVFLIQGDAALLSDLASKLTEKSIFAEVKILSRFTMDDAHELVTWNIDNTGNESWCVVYFDIFVADAAQVLLKTLEEPGAGVHMVLITPHPYLVPQTIRSRVRLLLTDVVQETPAYLTSKKALNEYIKDVLGNEDIEASDRRAEATKLLDAFEHKMKGDPVKIEYIYKAKEMLYKANMPTKQVVEYLATMVF